MCFTGTCPNEIKFGHPDSIGECRGLRGRRCPMEDEPEESQHAPLKRKLARRTTAEPKKGDAR